MCVYIYEKTYSICRSIVCQLPGFPLGGVLFFDLFFFGGVKGGGWVEAIPVGTLGSSCNMKSVNSHRDRGGRRRHPCNCRYFWTLESSCNLKSVNSHRDRGGRRRHPCNCRYFWTLESSCNLKSVNSHRDRGGRRRHPCNCRYFWTLESSCNYEKYQQSQGSWGSASPSL